MKKTLQRLKQDPRVSDAWDEGEDGMWVALKSGWYVSDYGDPVHCVHEWNTKDLLRAFRSVKPCACTDCASDAKRMFKTQSATP